MAPRTSLLHMPHPSNLPTLLTPTLGEHPLQVPVQASRGFGVLPLQDGEAVLAVQEVVQGVELDLLAVELEAVL